MSWQKDHRKLTAAFPDRVRSAHDHCSRHRAEIMASSTCGCFYCGARFPPAKVVEWVDEDETGEGQTAVCPDCGIDSVLGDASGVDLSQEFLWTMHAYWF